MIYIQKQRWEEFYLSHIKLLERIFGKELFEKEG